MQTKYQASQPMTTYKKGDMAKTRWQLAVRRWIANQQKSNSALPTIAATQSMPETGKVAEQKNTVLKPAAIDSGRETEGVTKHDVMVHLRAMTDRDSVRLCEFCFKPFTFKRNHAKYCSKSCSSDAYHVRKAKEDGRLDAYLIELGVTI